MKIAILQWNVWYKEKVENIINLIKKLDPDILCLQELTIGDASHQFRNLPEIIAKQLNYKYNFAKAHTFSGAFKNRGKIGNAIFTKGKIVKNNNFFITQTDKNKTDYSFEGRICAVSKIQLKGGKSITIATTHLSYNHKFIENKAKLDEIKKLTNFFKNHNEKLIFTGDLNIGPNTKSIKQIEKHLKHCGPKYSLKTWTTKPFDYQGFKETKLRWRLDYVFSSKDLKLLKSSIIKTKFSDHLPILTEIEI